MKKIITFMFAASLLNAMAQTLTTIAGNGSGENALDGPRGLVLNRLTGDVYFTDINNNKIKKLSASNGSVTLFAGNGSVGNINGTLNSCVLNRAAGLCINSAGTIMYITESGGHFIKKIDLQANTISVFAGDGSAGSANGTGTLATFNTPTDIDIDNNGNLFVADYGNNKIRKITPAGVVTDAATNISYPHGVAVDKVTGNVYTAGRSDNIVYKINTSGVVKQFAGKWGGGNNDGTGLVSAQFSSPMDLDTDMDGNLYVAEEGGRVRRIKLTDTTVTTLVGKTAKPNQYKDGRADTVLVNYCTGVAVKDTTTLFLTSLVNNVVKKYSRNFSVATGILNKSNTELMTSVFPNPTSSILNIQLPFNTSAAEIKVFDINGKLGLETISETNSHSLNVSGLQPGFYFIVITSDYATYKGRFIKQ
ncbi:MAG: T9SS type A sorting domain-containing protein [Bacteroidia bacterium]|nr:T9SS type A sorting domain-containing protein [Bacteroidia bacterium]